MQGAVAVLGSQGSARVTTAGPRTSLDGLLDLRGSTVAARVNLAVLAVTVARGTAIERASGQRIPSKGRGGFCSNLVPAEGGAARRRSTALVLYFGYMAWFIFNFFMCLVCGLAGGGGASWARRADGSWRLCPSKTTHNLGGGFSDRRQADASGARAVKLVKTGVDLRQSYERVGKRALIAHQRYAHAKQFKRANRALKTIRTYLGRVTW
jgi:hypothetical protein